MKASDRRGWTVLHLLAEKASGPEAPRPFIAAGADVNARTLVGETPLHIAARYNDCPTLLRYLVEEAGARRGARDADSWPPFERGQPGYDCAFLPSWGRTCRR